MKARKEYRFMSGFEMDAREEGRSEGFAKGVERGIAQGIEQGFSDGSYQTKLKTAKILKQLGNSVKKIMQATGLTKEEVESL